MWWAGLTLPDAPAFPMYSSAAVIPVPLITLAPELVTAALLLAARWLERQASLRSPA